MNRGAPQPHNEAARGRNRAVELLRCAIDVFIEYGYEGASLSRIIERSGGSRTVIY